MDKIKRDAGLDNLLDLNGQTLVIDAKLKYWVKFEVKKVKVSIERPHGLSYSLTLHNAKNERIVGFDNAHAIKRTSPTGKSNPQYDHKHRLKTIRPYEYQDAASLLSDFWSEVDKMLEEEGEKT